MFMHWLDEEEPHLVNWLICQIVVIAEYRVRRQTHSSPEGVTTLLQILLQRKYRYSDKPQSQKRNPKKDADTNKRFRSKKGTAEGLSIQSSRLKREAVKVGQEGLELLDGISLLRSRKYEPIRQHRILKQNKPNLGDVGAKPKRKGYSLISLKQKGNEDGIESVLFVAPELGYAKTSPRCDPRLCQ